MIREYQLNDIFPEAGDAFAVSIYIRTSHDGGMAGGLHFGGAVLDQGHIYTTHAARTKWIEIRSVTQGGHKILAQVTADKPKDGISFPDGIRLVIDICVQYHNGL